MMGEMDFGPQHTGRFLILIGAILVLAGVLFLLWERLGLFKLPGDVVFGGKSWRVYVPIASSLVLSVVLSLILWLIHHLRK